MRLCALSLNNVFSVATSSARYVLATICIAPLFAASAHAQVLNFKNTVELQFPSTVAISSDGKFAYVAKDFNLDPAAIEVYARDTTTGALTLSLTRV